MAKHTKRHTMHAHGHYIALLEVGAEQGQEAKTIHRLCHKVEHNNYKWKNHFYEMKGDVGMSLHEKERNKKMPTPRHKVTHNPIPTSLFCFNMLFVCLFVTNALGKANSTTS